MTTHSMTTSIPSSSQHKNNLVVSVGKLKSSVKWQVNLANGEHFRLLPFDLDLQEVVNLLQEEQATNYKVLPCGRFSWLLVVQPS